MDATIILKWALFALFLVLHPHTEGPITSTAQNSPFAPRPLCNVQLALANQACAYLPFSQAPPSPPDRDPPSPPSPSERHRRRHSHRHRHGHAHAHGHDHGHGNVSDQHHGEDQGHGHVPGQGHGENQGHGHGNHRHGHGHRHHRHKMSPVERQCCKWLAQVDDECVCELLVHLPPFLAKPIHEYTVKVDGKCNTTYKCGGRLRL